MQGWVRGPGCGSGQQSKHTNPRGEAEGRLGGGAAVGVNGVTAIITAALAKRASNGGGAPLPLPYATLCHLTTSGTSGAGERGNDLGNK